MIILNISTESARPDEEMSTLIQHLEFQAGLWSALYRQPIQVRSHVINTPAQPEPQPQALDGMVLG